MGPDLAFHWRKSSFSGASGECVELGVARRESSFGEGTSQCAEAAGGAVRDSKNPTGSMLCVDLGSLITFVKKS